MVADEDRRSLSRVLLIAFVTDSGIRLLISSLRLTTSIIRHNSCWYVFPRIHSSNIETKKSLACFLPANIYGFITQILNSCFRLTLHPEKTKVISLSIVHASVAVSIIGERDQIGDQTFSPILTAVCPCCSVRLTHVCRGAVKSRSSPSYSRRQRLSD